jgi:hypothetical protein
MRPIQPHACYFARTTGTHLYNIKPIVIWHGMVAS